MKLIHTFIAIPSLPEAIKPLQEIAHNLRWAWNHDTIGLFRRLDSQLWEDTGHNPVLMLGNIDQSKLQAAAEDEGFLAHLARVNDELSTYKTTSSTWFQRKHGSRDHPLVAYFSAEFGVTECLSIFAGGLGVLAGDHLKSASDLGLPLIGVGILYQQGYFRQYLNEAGWQQESYENNDFYNLPITLQRQGNGEPILIQVPHPGRLVTVQIWRAQVGRVPLYLLDTNIPQNRPEDRDITDQLYGGDLEMRIRQEMVLGIGGYRALQVLGLEPDVYHINEGHSAFLSLERIRQLMETKGLSFPEAKEAARGGIVFTTHTPVPAGHDYFPPQLIERYLGEYIQAFGLTRRDFLALGQKDPGTKDDPFCMTVLALRMASFTNGVSRLHGQVSRRMWQSLWPGVPEDEIPITHITNGVHSQSWVSRDMNELYERYLGPRWREESADLSVWQQTEHIAAEELWRTHERRRERLVAFCRRRLRDQLRKRGASQTAIEIASEVLDPYALTIGFARRFATYKRATLILRDRERLAKILNDPERPVQIIFAGKAHPKDEPGKDLIRQIVELASQDEFRRRLVFLEDYDMAATRYMVQGVDVWLNTPLRPREASGTSGMKAAANGVLNMSILDGWWDEAYTPEVGWAIGRRETYTDHNYQDQVEAEALYGLLEQEIIPTFYTRGVDGLPRRWITCMKSSIQNLCPRFNTNRMVGEYAERFYLPAASLYNQLTADGMAHAKELAAWKKRIQENWSQVSIKMASRDLFTEIGVGEDFQIQAQVHLGNLAPKDVLVELYMGKVDASEEVEVGEPITMQHIGTNEAGDYIYQANGIQCQESGMHGFTLRVLPDHPDLVSPFLPGIITWA